MRLVGIGIVLLLAWSVAGMSAGATTPPGIRYAIPEETAGISSLALSVNGQILASASSSGTVKLWRMSDGTLLHTFRTGGAPTTVVFSPNGTTVAAGDAAGNVYSWNVANSALLRGWVPYTRVTSLAYSPDGSTLAVAGEDAKSNWSIALLSSLNLIPQDVLWGATAPITQVGFPPSSKNVLFSAQSDGTVRIWNTFTAQIASVLTAFTNGGVNGLAFSRDGKLWAALGGNDSSSSTTAVVKIWNVQPVALKATLSTTFGSNALNTVAFSPDGTLLALGGTDNGSNLPETYNVATNKLVQRFAPGHNAPVRALLFSTNGSLLISAGDDHQVLEWSVAKGALSSSLYPWLSVPTDVVFSGDGAEMAFAVPGVGTSFRSSMDGSDVLDLPDATAPFAFSADSTLFAYTRISATGAVVMDLNSVTPVGNIPSVTPSLMRLSADDQSLSALISGYSIDTLDLSDQMLNQITSPTQTAPLATSNDRSRFAVASVSGTGLDIWSFPDGKRVGNVSTYPGGPVSLSDYGNYVAFSSGGTVFVYTYTGTRARQVFSQTGSGATINALALSPFGDSVAVYRNDGSITILGLNGKVIATWTDQLGSGIAWMRFTPDSDSLLLARTDGPILVCYNPSPAVLVSLILSPAAVTGGKQTGQGIVTISLPAPASGISIALSSSNPTLASVPSQVMIAANSTSATFPITSSAITKQTTVTISAARNGIVQSAPLTLNVSDPLRTMSLAATTVQGGGDTSGVVTLTAPAYAGGVTVALSSSNPTVLAVPATVTVPAGATSASFLVWTNPVITPRPITVSATASGVTMSKVLTVAPGTLSALTLLPSLVKAGGQDVTGVVTLTAPARVDIIVTLSVTTSGTAGYVSYPSTITIPAGQLYGLFDIVTNSIPSGPQTVIFQAQIGATGASGTTFQTANLTLTM